ncbi:MAG: methylenetetrahydrofolate reductase [Actinobacteria bacterium]|nr:methylenetetrahydrofolate reductase [Actinomycetota bacterium]MCL5446959.1 methylenetetrahydrofolate reductase [Actinomycetota bacterium]
MTKISELIAGGTSFSVELWPPRNPGAEARLEQVLSEIEPLRPTFTSITYGAGGSTRERTHDLVVRIAREGVMTPMAHLVCAAHSKDELTGILSRYRDEGVDNILALMGDPPLDATTPLARGELAHAIELVELAKEVGDFCVAVAAHPEGHPQSSGMEADRNYLAEKLAVADFAITQFFFDVDYYFRLLDDLDARGLDKPVLPGIMPVTRVRTVYKMAELSGTQVPGDLMERLEKVADMPEEVRRIGIEVATGLGARLLAGGAPGLHFYTMNESVATIEIARALGIGAERLVQLPGEG